MGPEKNIEYQFMENYQIKYEARHGPVPAYQFRENISLHSINLERVYCKSNFQTKNKTRLCNSKIRTQELKTKTQNVQNKHET